MSQVDWLSHLLRMITITGQLEVRCAYGAPWRVAWAQSAAHVLHDGSGHAPGLTYDRQGSAGWMLSENGRFALKAGYAQRSCLEKQYRLKRIIYHNDIEVELAFRRQKWVCTGRSIIVRPSLYISRI